MATTLFSSLSLMCSILLCFLLSINYIEGRISTLEHQHVHTVLVQSLLSSTTCKDSTKVLDKKASLKVVHKHGPCFQQSDKDLPTAKDVLIQDQSRVDSIHSKLSGVSKQQDSGVKVTDSTTLPAKDGSTVGSGNYIVVVGLGTPKKDLSLIFDTGSDITWTQCRPCVRSCYSQRDPIFDPSQSKSYSNISCSSSVCNSLTSATGNSPGCSSSTCVYGIQYGDQSFSAGFFGTERLTLTATDAFDNFYFGCGQNNQGLFGGSAGLLGLGRDKLSVVSQTSSKYNKVFSYCLPSTASATGFLTFGGYSAKSPKFTPMTTISASPSFYGIGFTAISVGGRTLSISQSVFTAAGALIDSGTVISRLPPAAYSALRAAFRQGMSKYPTAPALSILDTCYDLSNYTTVSVPKVALLFTGGVEVDLTLAGILYANKVSQVCLAFAGNSDATDVAIFGNTQQQSLEVVYDGAGGRLGFAPNGCN